MQVHLGILAPSDRWKNREMVMDTTEAWEGWNTSRGPNEWHHWAPTAAADFRSTTCFRASAEGHQLETQQSPGSGLSVDPLDRSFPCLVQQGSYHFSRRPQIQHSEHHPHQFGAQCPGVSVSGSNSQVQCVQLFFPR